MVYFLGNNFGPVKVTGFLAYPGGRGWSDWVIFLSEWVVLRFWKWPPPMVKKRYSPPPCRWHPPVDDAFALSAARGEVWPSGAAGRQLLVHGARMGEERGRGCADARLCRPEVCELRDVDGDREPLCWLLYLCCGNLSNFYPIKLPPPPGLSTAGV